MEKINTLDEYKAAIKWNKSRFESIIKNCIVMAPVINKFIEEDRFYIQKYDNGIVFLVDEIDYYNAFYYWDSEKVFDDFHQDKPVLIEEVDYKESRKEYLSILEPKLFSAGFELIRNNLQLEIMLEENIEAINQSLSEKRDRLKESNLSAVICDDTSMYAKAVDLWLSALDETDIPADHRYLNNESELLCFVSDSGEIATTAWWKNSGALSECRHTVTHPDYYRRGLASLSILIWLSTVYEQGVKKCLGWASDQNYASLEMLRKIGFTLNQRVSKQYILK